MFKKILSIIFCLIISHTVACANIQKETALSVEAAETYANELMNKVKHQRSAIYDSLELTEEQVVQINQIDQKLYSQTEPKLVKLALITQKLENLANSSCCNKKTINAIREEFKAAEKELDPIKKEYKRELYGILSSEQKSKYRLLRKQKQKEIKKELKKQIAEQKKSM